MREGDKRMVQDISINTKQLHIAIIDHYQMFREGVRKILEEVENFKIMISSDDFSMLYYILETNGIDILLIDVKMFDQYKQEVEYLITNSSIKVIVLGNDVDHMYIKEAVLADVQGYLFKEMEIFTFIEAIHKVSQGKMYFHPLVSEGLVKDYKQILIETSEQHDEEKQINRPLHICTKRECQVLQLITDGQSNLKIAETLNISDKTVKNHVSNLLKKLQVNDRTQAVVKAIRNNWVSL